MRKWTQKEMKQWKQLDLNKIILGLFETKQFYMQTCNDMIGVEFNSSCIV